MKIKKSTLRRLIREEIKLEEKRRKIRKKSLKESDVFSDLRKSLQNALTNYTPASTIGTISSAIVDCFDNGILTSSGIKKTLKSWDVAKRRIEKFTK